MLKAVGDKLKTGKIKNVVVFGSPRPKAPYVVIKPERAPLGQGWRLEIWAHFMPGQQYYLMDYVQNDLMTLLDDYSYQSIALNNNKVLTTQELSGIVTNNDDGTISMKREFLVPSRTF